jgi:hypothetical protein
MMMTNLDTALQNTIEQLSEMQKIHLLNYIQSMNAEKNTYLQLTVEERLKRAEKSFGTINTKARLTLEDLRRENMYGEDER